MKKQLFIYIVFAIFSIGYGYSMEKTYTKLYAQNGRLEAEGWMSGTIKTGYWKFYHENGKVSQKGAFKNNNRDGYWFFFRSNADTLKEGHYKEGKATGWWVFHDDILGRTEKCQYRKDQKQGYCFYYRNKKLFRAEKYELGKRTNEWTNLAGFIADNPNPSF